MRGLVSWINSNLTDGLLLKLGKSHTRTHARARTHKHTHTHTHTHKHKHTSTHTHTHKHTHTHTHTHNSNLTDGLLLKHGKSFNLPPLASLAIIPNLSLHPSIHLSIFLYIHKYALSPSFLITLYFATYCTIFYYYDDRYTCGYY